MTAAAGSLLRCQHCGRPLTLDRFDDFPNRRQVFRVGHPVAVVRIPGPVGHRREVEVPGRMFQSLVEDIAHVAGAKVLGRKIDEGLRTCVSRASDHCRSHVAAAVTGPLGLPLPQWAEPWGKDIHPDPPATPKAAPVTTPAPTINFGVGKRRILR